MKRCKYIQKNMFNIYKLEKINKSTIYTLLYRKYRSGSLSEHYALYMDQVEQNVFNICT